MVSTVFSRCLAWVIGVLMAVSLVACGGGGGGSEPPAATGTVKGLAVSSATDLPVAGVAVSSGTSSATTAADGSYTLSAVAPGAAVLAFSKSGYAASHANATVVAGQTSTASARLTPVGVSQTYSAAVGATVSVASTPAQVTLPAGGIVNASGAAYTGNVTVELTPINPAADSGNMPGDLTASIGGSIQPIESFGALTVTLQDGSGNKLNLAAGKTSTVRIPLATRSATPPATVPLFYFDEATGMWVEQGTATLQGTAPSQYYEGTVSHFTTWNADQPTNTITVTGCVQDVNAVRVVNARVRTDGLDYSGSSVGFTDANGNFSLPMRKGSTASVAAELEGRYSNAVTAGPSQGTIALANCLLLGNGTPVFIVQPAGQSVTEGATVVLQAYARGTAPIRYQWQRNGSDVGGATGNSLLIDPVRNADNGAVYRVVASNGAGSTNSDTATLVVASLPPAFAVQPAPQNVVAGTAATFSVVMQAQGAPLQYQWLRDGQAINTAIGSSYTLNPAQLADSGAHFSVRVTNSVGHVTSDAALLTVTAAPVAPSITTQPASISVYTGQSAQFSVVASGSAPLHYQWRRNGTDINGAQSDSYTLTTTVLADSGAKFSVVVTNDAGNRTSNDATLTVTDAPPSSGYYLIAEAGATASGAFVYANGSQTASTAALIAVNTTGTPVPATLEVAGATTGVFTSVFETTVQGNQISDTHARYSFYFKNSLLYRIDHRSPTGAPAPQRVSTLTTGDVCGQNGRPDAGYFESGLEDVQDPTRSWIVLHAPGADGQCGTSDDNYRAVRAGATSTDVALTIAGRPVLGIVNGTTGALTGVIVVEGSLLRRLDANLANAVTLQTLSSANASLQDTDFGTTLPGTLLFFDGTGLYGYKLDGSAGAPTLLNTLSADEANGNHSVSSYGGTAYVALSTSTGSRILSITENLVVSDLGAGPGSVSQLRVTPTRLVFQGQTGLTSMLRSGGGSVTLASSGAVQGVSGFSVAGENVYYTLFSYQPSYGVSVGIVNSDGSNPQTLSNANIIGSTFAPSISISTLRDDGVYAVIIADGVTGGFNAAGSTVRALNGATRAPLLSYGTLPASPSPAMAYVSEPPEHYGQPGLLTLFAEGNGSSGSDLLYFDSDSAGSLIRLTNSIAPAAAGKLRPLSAAAATTPGPVVRAGLLRLAPQPSAAASLRR